MDGNQGQENREGVPTCPQNDPCKGKSPQDQLCLVHQYVMYRVCNGVGHTLRKNRNSLPSRGRAACCLWSEVPLHAGNFYFTGGLAVQRMHASLAAWRLK